jgi:hypothetical protein
VADCKVTLPQFCAAKLASLRQHVARPAEALESILNPKDYLVDLLTLAGLRYTAEVCRAIAAEADLDLVRRHCPSFENFISKVVER